MIPKALVTRLKDILPYLISSNQTAYVKKIISESGRLIYDVLETVSILNEKEFLVTVDIKKLLNWLTILLLAALQKYGFGERFPKCIQILIKNQEPWILNGGITTTFFSVDRGVRQEKAISAFLFLLALEVSFVLIKTNNKIKGLDIYGNNFLYTAYADDSSFFKSKECVIEVFKILDEFSFFSGLKSNKQKCEVADIGVKKGIKG